MNETIPQLTIEKNEDGTITLEQDGLGTEDRVTVHPIHLRLMAERLGLVRQAIASEKELLRDMDRLKRNMLRVREHALQLQHKFKTGADWVEADLTFEMGLINTLVDLLDMAVDDFVDDFAPSEPEPYPRTTCTPARAAPPHVVHPMHHRRKKPAVVPGITQLTLD